MSIYKKLQAIQSELEVPKSQYNSFGKYHYRNAEDILAAAKPVCNKHNCTLIVSDELVFEGGRYYIKATAMLVDNDASDPDKMAAVQVDALAREEETKKGMDAAQITGSTSSYARKYALNGLFCLDDVKDADHMNNGKTTVDAVKEMFPGTEEMLDNLTITPADVMACEGCGAGMTSGQITLSQKKFDGKTLCVKCQKEVA